MKNHEDTSLRQAFDCSNNLTVTGRSLDSDTKMDLLKSRLEGA